MRTYLLAGGGTAGHVNPLLALAEHIKDQEPESKILVLGTAEGLEARLVPDRGFELLTIPRLPFPRRPSVYALKFPANFTAAVKQVRQMIRENGVDTVVGFGGYASAPAYRAAKKENISYFIHEANARPGLANLMGKRGATAIAVTFSNTPIKGAAVTGMPLRKEIVQLDTEKLRAEARQSFGLDPQKRTLVITGGSLGARSLNEAFFAKAADLIENGIQVLHIWGGLTKLQDPGIPGYKVIEYCNRMDYAFAAATLLVSRAGSTAVSEISGLGLPAVFVPYATGNGEQRLNAKDVVDAGGAILKTDEELTPVWITEDLIPLLHDDVALRGMSAKALKVGSLKGTKNLYELVTQVAEA